MWIILQWNQTAKLFSNGNRKSLEWRLDDKLLHELSELDSNHRTWNYPFSKTDCTHPAVCGWDLSWFTIFFHHCCLLLIFLISKNCNEISKGKKKHFMEEYRRVLCIALKSSLEVVRLWKWAGTKFHSQNGALEVLGLGPVSMSFLMLSGKTGFCSLCHQHYDTRCCHCVSCCHFLCSGGWGH